MRVLYGEVGDLSMDLHGLFIGMISVWGGFKGLRVLWWNLAGLRKRGNLTIIVFNS